MIFNELFEEERLYLLKFIAIKNHSNLHRVKSESLSRPTIHRKKTLLFKK